MSSNIDELAKNLAEAWRTGGTTPLPDKAPASRAEAYTVQDRMAELIGGKVVGWKVGATVRAVQVFEGHDGPLPGRVFADRYFDSPAKFPASKVRGAKVECEFAMRLTKDLPRSSAPVKPADLAGHPHLPSLDRAGRRPLCSRHRQPCDHHIRRHRRQRRRRRRRARSSGHQLARPGVRAHEDRRPHRQQPAHPDV